MDAAPLPGAGKSELLRCLEQLNDEVWGQFLLPRLIANKSAGAFALTCTRLRELCQRTHGRLCLARLCSSAVTRDTAAADRWAAGLVQHFPSCAQVDLGIERLDSYVMVSSLLHTLSCFANLSTVQLTVSGTAQPTSMAMVLNSMQKQLQHLTTLVLCLHQSWAGKHEMWQQLARYSQLTKLHIMCKSRSWRLVEEVAALRDLRGLQDLFVNQPRSDPTQLSSTASMSFLQGLTSLTSLQLPLWCAEGFDSISCCKNLLQLHLRRPGSSHPAPAVGWSSLVSLSALTTLQLSDILGASAPAFYEVLPQMTQLLGVSSNTPWAPAALRAFAAMPGLLAVGGPWQNAVDDMPSGSLVCRVTELCSVAGNVPFAAFPNLQVVSAAGAISGPALSALTRSCRQLRQLLTAQTGSNSQPPHSTLDHNTDDASRVAAILGLSRLTALTALTYRPNSHRDLAALTDALQHLRVQRLVVECAANSTLLHLSGGLLQLGSLQMVSKLELLLWDRVSSQDVAEMLLLQLRHMPSVTVCVVNSAVTMFELAILFLQRLGLQVAPAVQVVGLS